MSIFSIFSNVSVTEHLGCLQMLDIINCTEMIISKQSFKNNGYSWLCSELTLVVAQGTNYIMPGNELGLFKCKTSVSLSPIL